MKKERVIRLGSYMRYLVLKNQISRFFDQDILDVGCNYGEFMQYLKDKNRVVGLEPDQEAIKKAAVFNPDLKIKKGNATKLPFTDKKFEVVVSLCVLEHIADDQKAFGEIARVLKPKGLFIFTVPTASFKLIGPFAGNIIKVINAVFKTDFPQTDEEYVHFGQEGIGHVRRGYSLKRIKEILAKNNFRLISCKTYWHLPSRLAYLLFSPLIKVSFIPLELIKYLFRFSLFLDKFFPDSHGDYCIIAEKQ